MDELLQYREIQGGPTMRRPFALVTLVVGLALVASCGGQPALDSGATKVVVA